MGASMRDVVVIFENTRGRKVFGEDATRGTMGEALAAWLTAAIESAKQHGVCKSFVVGVHVAGADCDHEVNP
jgi:hypothetical protein